MDETCQDCGKLIGRYHRANLWNAERIVCTVCLNLRHEYARRMDSAYKIAGQPGSPWFVQIGQEQRGPYSTRELIALLWAARVGWDSKVWRKPMASWTPVARLFAAPKLPHGRPELRDYHQGDGTYHPKTYVHGLIS